MDKLKMAEEALGTIWQQMRDNHSQYSSTGDRESDIRFFALGLSGEAGEVANLVKKRWRDDIPHDREIKREIADVCAYAFMLADTLGLAPLDLFLLIHDKQLEFVEKQKALAAIREDRDG